jgi:hypothetical protein
MGHSRDDDFPHGDVFTSETYRQDAINAVVYAVLAVLLLGASAIVLAFVDSRSGLLGAQGVAENSPLSTGQARQLGSLCAYFAGAVGLLSFLVAGYSGLVRPLQRATGMLDGAGDDSTDGSRTAISVEMVAGRRRVDPDAGCVDCEETAIGVVTTGFEDDTPRDVLPVCPTHLHERRDELEATDLRFEVETFA